MTTTEDRARAAMRAIAGTVHDAPLLRLGPDPERPPPMRCDSAGTARAAPVRPARPPAPAARPGSRRPRDQGTQAGAAAGDPGWSRVTAAAVVVALAIALVIIRDIPNGGAVPANPATVNRLPGWRTPLLRSARGGSLPRRRQRQ